MTPRSRKQAGTKFTPHSARRIGSSPPTDDEINNNSLLLFLFNASDEHKFEIMSVKSFEALGGGNYRAKVRRSAFGTKTGGDGSHVWTTNDRAFFIFRQNLFPLTPG